MSQIDKIAKTNKIYKIAKFVQIDKVLTGCSLEMLRKTNKK